MEGQLLRSKPTTAATRYRDEAFSRDLRLGPFSRLRGQSTTSGFVMLDQVSSPSSERNRSETPRQGTPDKDGGGATSSSGRR
jgi:hypothetical protein